MKSVDTNVLARAILRDAEGQTERALRALSGPVLVTVTVVVELVWVLAGVGKQSRADIVAHLSALIEVAHIHFAEEAAVRWALARFAAGADFADMLHVALSEGTAAFVTFDRGIASYAAGTPVPIETL